MVRPMMVSGLARAQLVAADPGAMLRAGSCETWPTLTLLQGDTTNEIAQTAAGSARGTPRHGPRRRVQLELQVVEHGDDCRRVDGDERGPANSSPLKIGVMLPLSGPLAGSSADYAPMVPLLTKEPGNSTIDGRPVAGHLEG